MQTLYWFNEKVNLKTLQYLSNLYAIEYVSIAEILEYGHDITTKEARDFPHYVNNATRLYSDIINKHGTLAIPNKFEEIYTAQTPDVELDSPIWNVLASLKYLAEKGFIHDCDLSFFFPAPEKRWDDSAVQTTISSKSVGITALGIDFLREQIQLASD